MEGAQSEERFGKIAVKRGFITPDQLKKALSIQEAEFNDKGNHRFIGNILSEQGLISISQIDEILESIGKGPALV